MDPTALQDLFERVRRGELSSEQAVASLAGLGQAELGFARLDLERRERQGVPEVIYGPSKTEEQLIRLLETLAQAGQNVMVTRLTPEVGRRLVELRPSSHYDADSGLLYEESQPVARRTVAPVAIVTAGTGDIPVAREASRTLELLGFATDCLFDVGVAGIHRLFAVLERIQRAPAVIVVAGMEGALPSVVGGLVSAPIVAVPTSVGYGAAFGGATALMGMLTSCAAGVVVVNIDNGFGAAMAVARILDVKAGP
ncbi:MAG TPA: nickel pincer cofactor biosynthesis protein LarB [Polyangiaceae bacterium]|nr:nickel pincer cofactor biosynthesis protein LarB [Polyangiaceae bacterium]